MEKRVRLLQIGMWAIVVFTILFFVVMIIAEHSRYSNYEKMDKETSESFYSVQYV